MTPIDENGEYWSAHEATPPWIAPRPQVIRLAVDRQRMAATRTATERLVEQGTRQVAADAVKQTRSAFRSS